MIRPRWWSHFWAWVNGYFWLPCPICGQMFAPFEAAQESLTKTPHLGHLVCADCCDEVHLRNAAFVVSKLGLRQLEPGVRPLVCGHCEGDGYCHGCGGRGWVAP